jgi:hypothetical protein
MIVLANHRKPVDDLTTIAAVVVRMGLIYLIPSRKSTTSTITITTTAALVATEVTTVEAAAMGIKQQHRQQRQGTVQQQRWRHLAIS